MAQPGWYNDDVDPTIVRWHDGAAWTEWVADKAHWEAVGHAPPAPDQDEPAAAPPWAGRVPRAWMAIGGAVAVLVVVLAGVALGSGGSGGGSSKGTPGPPRPASHVTSSTSAFDAIGDVSTDSSIDDDGDLIPGTGGSSSSRSASAATTGANGKTTTTKKSTVTHTETRTESHINPATTSPTVSGDKTSVGHSNPNNSVTNTLPPSATSTTAATTTTTEAPTTTADPNQTGGPVGTTG